MYFNSKFVQKNNTIQLEYLLTHSRIIVGRIIGQKVKLESSLLNEVI